MKPNLNNYKLTYYNNNNINLEYGYDVLSNNASIPIPP